jgi:hypothetical protein
LLASPRQAGQGRPNDYRTLARAFQSRFPLHCKHNHRIM